jgi:hypothetical protein
MGVTDVLNKGLPYETELSIYADDIEKICATDTIGLHFKMTQDFDSVINKLKQKYSIPFNDIDKLLVVVIDNDLKRKVIVDCRVFLLKIARVLNVNYTEDTKEYIKNIRKAISELNKIRNERELEKKFPELYRSIYYVLVKERDDVAEFRKTHKEKDMPKDYLEEMRNLDKKHLSDLKQYGINTKNFNFKNFIDGMYNTLNVLYKNILNYNLVNDCWNLTLDFDKYNDYIDIDKFELLIAATYMRYANLSDSKDDLLITSVSYLAQFFAEHEMDLNNNTKITWNEKEYTIISLYEEFKQFLLEHPEVKIIRKNVTDFEGQTLEDVKKYIEQYKNELSVSWEILPSGVLQYSNIISQNTSSDEDKNIDVIREKKEKMLSEKEEFFKKHEPYLILMGKASFKGYIGHVYPNAYVVLEKFYKNTNCTSIASEAIYIMNVDEFVTLSIKSKPEIIENHLCHRVTHHRGWQGRVEEILKKSPDLNSIEKVQTFENAIRQSK